MLKEETESGSHCLHHALCQRRDGVYGAGHGNMGGGLATATGAATGSKPTGRCTLSSVATESSGNTSCQQPELAGACCVVVPVSAAGCPELLLASMGDHEQEGAGATSTSEVQASIESG